MMPAPNYEQTLRGSIPPGMRRAKRWILWRNEPRSGSNRKVPYYANGKRRQGTLDTAADWANLATFDDALAAFARGSYSGLGFALGPDQETGHHWQGIDFDHLDQHPALNAIKSNLPGYIEVSPSGDGLHAIGIGPDFRTLGSNKSGIEAYAKGRYFTVTGQAVSGDLEDLSAFVAGVLAPMHSPQRNDSPSTGSAAAPTESVFAKINTKALQNLHAWVPGLFPRARQYKDGYRIASADLGRQLQEDISILPIGSKDFGEERPVTPIDLVIEWGPVSDAKAAALWLCQQLHIDPKTIGWKVRTDNVVPLPTKQQPTSEPDNTALSEPEGAETHFRPLGYDGDKFYFMPRKSQQVRELSANKLGRKPELLTLAPLDWWEREFAEDSGFSGRSVDMAANYLIQRCLDAGIFSMDLLRGRGVWRDGQSIVIHAGDQLFVDGIQTDLVNAKTDAVYERKAKIPISLANPLDASESRALLELGKKLNFEAGTHARLWAGWPVVAMISGALIWRPHVLINGPKGCGKTTNISILARLLGKMALSVTGGTSEAGLRQTLAYDALPVIFDEAEGDSKRSAQIIDNVLALMRHASSGFDAKVIKGGQDGKANASMIQSCFMLSAIRDPIQQAADQSRVTVLPLMAIDPVSEGIWKREGQALAEMVCSPEWAGRLRARVFSRVPQLLETIDVYREAAAAHFGEQRMGDQIGTLLAGGWLLASDKIPTLSAARKDLDTLPWHDQEEVIEDASDEKSCFHAILEAHVKVDTNSGWHGEVSVAEIVALLAFNDSSLQQVSAHDAKRSLALYGMRVETGPNPMLTISNTNGMLARKIMSHTNWPRGWGKLLARLPGANKQDGVVKIGGHVSRCVSVPIER